jgi:hypothetical protein
MLNVTLCAGAFTGKAPTISANSIIRFTYPISLSDHAITFTHVPSTTVLEER